MSDRFDLSGKVALVTGGSRGLGKAMAMAFAEAGADVVVASRKLDNCERVAHQVPHVGVGVEGQRRGPGGGQDLKSLLDFLSA